MKIVKVNKSEVNAYKSIANSMNKKKEKVSICNGLDACACTGNGNC